MKLSKALCSLALAAMSLTAAQAQAPQKPDVRCAENRVIYELFTRNFSQDSKFTSVTAQMDRLKALGVDVIWMMPIQQLGDLGKWGTYSSPYAVKDYYNVDPMYGSNADFQALVNAAHARGMEVWLDWVGNHTSLDAVWTSTHPEYYGDDYGNHGFFNPSGWADVYNLNYNRADTREATAAAMAHWVNTYNVDGFRLDNTEGVSDDHWRMIKQSVESKISRQITWLAETGEDHIVQNGVFDCNYAWGYGDYLRNNGLNPSVQGLKDWSSGLHNLNIYKGKNRMVYLTNHDVQQDAGGTEDKWFGDNLKPFTVLEFTIYGMPLIYNGQEVKYSHYDKIMLSEKNVINWNGDASMTQLITDLCHLKHTEPALRCFSQAGELINYNASNGNVYVYERRRGSYSVVVMLNFNGSQANFTVSGLPSASYIDYFNQSAGYKNLATAGSFTLPARGYAVFIKNDDGNVVEPDPQPDTYNTVTFVRPDGWSNTPNVHIYYPKEVWGGSDDVAYVNSQPMTAAGNNTFTYSVKNLSDRYNIMFNNGGWDNGATPSLYEETRGDYTYALQGGELVHYTGGGQGNTEPEPDPTPQPVACTIDFVRPDGWNATPHIHIYYQASAWGDAADVTVVDNQEMSLAAGKTRTFTYTAQLKGRFNIIFNNGGWGNAQSASYYVENPGNYTFTLDGDLNVVPSDGEPAVTPDPDPQPTTHTVAIAGDVNGWSESANAVTVASGADAEIVIDPWTNGTYGFKVVIDGDYYTNRSENVPADGTWQYNLDNPSGMGNNMRLNNAAEGKKVKFTVNPATHSFKAEIIEAPAPQPATYTVNFDNGLTEWAEVYAYVWGGEGSATGTENAGWPGMKMTLKGGTVYTCSFDALWTPDHVIFHNNTESGKTADLEFINNHTYGDPKPQPKVCATPVISIYGNSVRVTCSTPGAQLHTNVAVADHGLTHHASGEEIALNGQYLITSYATAPGHEDSPEATAAFVWVKNYNLPSHNDLIDGNMGRAVIVRSTDDNIVVEGTTYGEPVALYDLSGYCLYLGTATTEPFTIPADLIKGQIYILHIGDRQIKYLF